MHNKALRLHVGLKVMHTVFMALHDIPIWTAKARRCCRPNQLGANHHGMSSEFTTNIMARAGSINACNKVKWTGEQTPPC